MKYQDLKAKDAEATNALSVIEAFEFLMAHYGISWRQSSDKEYTARQLSAWMASLEDVSKDQINYGRREISRANYYVDFPPNAGQFRKLCQMMPKPYVAPSGMIRLGFDESPEAVAERKLKVDEAKAHFRSFLKSSTKKEAIQEEPSKLFIAPKKKADELIKIDNYLKSKGIKPVGIDNKISENIPTQNNMEQTIDDPQYSKTG